MRLFSLQTPPDTAPRSRTRFRQGPITRLAFPATNDRKRLSYATLHNRRPRQTRRLGRDTSARLGIFLAPPTRAATLGVYAMDWTTVRRYFFLRALLNPAVFDRRRQGSNPRTHHRLRVRQTTQTGNRLPHKVESFLFSRCMLTTI